MQVKQSPDQLQLTFEILSLQERRERLDRSHPDSPLGGFIGNDNDVLPIY